MFENIHKFRENLTDDRLIIHAFLFETRRIELTTLKTFALLPFVPKILQRVRAGEKAAARITSLKRVALQIFAFMLRSVGYGNFAGRYPQIIAIREKKKKINTSLAKNKY